jgi:hypothetical protein
MFILIGLSFAIDRILARISSHTAHRIFVGPGVVIHEYSHALACLLTRTKIFEIKLFESEGGHVTHEKRNPLTMTVIAMAPLFGGIIFILLLSMLFNEIGVVFSGKFVSLEPNNFLQAFFGLIVSAGYTFYENIAMLNHVTIFFFIFLYFVGSMVAVLAPSKTDLENAAVGLIILFIVAVLTVWLKPLSYIPGVTEYFNSATPALDIIIETLSKGISVGFLAVFVFMIPLLVIYFIKRS